MTRDSRQRRGAKTREEKAAQKASRERKERNIREQKEAAAGRVSYVRKPVSTRSVIGMTLTVIGVLLGAYCLYRAYATYGRAPFAAGGPALCSIVCGLAALGYHISAIRERDKNRILSKIGLVLTAMFLLLWAAVFAIGMSEAG